MSNLLSEARKLVEQAIEGPWTVRGNDDETVVVDANGMWVAIVGRDHDSAAFIAAARTIVPQLIAECERIRAEARGNYAAARNLTNDVVVERDAYRGMLCDLLAAAHVHPVERSMSAHWERARELLRNGPVKP